MKVKVNTSLCASSGRCVWHSGRIFDQDPETGIAKVINENPPPELYAEAQDAADNCPTRAISIEQ